MTVQSVEDELPESFYALSSQDIKGNIVTFANFEGKVVYVVNVASMCGYTASNYAEFKKLAKLRERGLEIMIFPCGQFGNQEYSEPSDIESFAERQGFEGLVMQKTFVNGKFTSPVFRFLKEMSGKHTISW